MSIVIKLPWGTGLKGLKQISSSVCELTMSRDLVKMASTISFGVLAITVKA
jgi:hypothetical protein